MMKKRLLGLMLLLCVLAVGDVSAQSYSYVTNFDTLDAEWDLWNVSHAPGYLFNSSGDAAYARVELLHDGGLLEMALDIRRVSADWYMYSTLSVDNGAGGYDNYCPKEWGYDVIVGEPYTTWYHSCNDVPAGAVWLYVYFMDSQEALHLGAVSISAPLANPISTPTPAPTATNEPSPTETAIPTATPTPGITPELPPGITAEPPTPTLTPTPDMGNPPMPSPTAEIGEPPAPTPLPTEIGLPPVPIFTVTPFASGDGRSITQTLPPGWGADLPISMTMSGDFPPLPPPVDYQAFGTMDWEWDIAFGLEHFAMIISAARTLPLMITSLPYYPYVIFFLLILTAYKIIGRIIFTDSGASGEVPNQPRQGKGGS